jgi:Rrf2 family protein
MRMTAASEYGCLAMLAIAERDGEWTRREDITSRFDIPSAFLEQILRKLAAAGFVVSRRGAGGGFRLARPASDVVVAEVVRSLDGALAPTRSVSENFYQPSPVEASEGFHHLFRRVRDAIAEILENTTLEDVLAHERTIRSRPRRARARSRTAAAPVARRR